MTLSKESQDALEVIRFKVEKQQYDLKGIESNCLKVVFEELQFTFVGKKVKLDIDCPGCIKTAMNVVKNYVDFYEPRVIRTKQPDKPANVTRVTVGDTVVVREDKKVSFEMNTELQKTVQESIDEQVDLKQLTIPQLQAICKEQDIKFHHKAKEAYLIQLILDKQNEEAN
jgi:hypothetical protein